MRAILLGLMLFIAIAPAVGQTLPGEPFDVQTVLDEQKQIDRDIDAGNGTYARLDEISMQELRERQRKLVGLLEGHQYEDLDETQRSRARTHMIFIKYLGKTDDDQLVCVRKRATGSNRVERICKLVAQQRDETKNSKDQAMQMLQNRTIAPCGPGC
ncbi:hypothetical protein [Lysobacter capsici]|uniref:hypothetical protein n=1 Tax=Lysobacter capsici TaxID=435897 RepID=UPI001C0031C2|nr:hypothetical protein [Lysobacter capsici]MBW8810456.1 hypothetical protein [Lysobacter sp.]QWF16257.1 hypothetical protein KME82_21275 [Lysobacter capsici]